MPSSAETPSEDARVARTRADVARAALEVLRSDGFDELSHARVADRAGYSKTTLYTHWPSRLDLLRLALDALGQLPHHEPTGDLRADLVAELRTFRGHMADLRLDRVLCGLSDEAGTQTPRLRDRITAEAQRGLRAVLAQRYSGVRLDAALSMLTGVVAGPSLMLGALPDDAALTAAVDLLLGMGEDTVR
ncbi:TetR/AcrR family transcriptional regulator [Mycolicibacterium sp. 018/SC-01/001]|uniref:TetR/AcrR family transcriptional regulator n=1 Tax=Mycolicibacterium sp. 018/SC-01/001 TaxID=2592069 RepID=UPI00163D5577|nr:TetR/AcrR family transcriptional regulator [Mycolicibacterium sp. 018/SC-01/001]